MDTSILAEELEPLNAQIEQVRKKIESLKEELRSAEAEFDLFSTDRQRFDALQDVCNALDKLNELDAQDLFWKEVTGDNHDAGYTERLRNRIAQFEDETHAFTEKRETLKSQINHYLDEMDELYAEVRDAYAREERRKEEFVIERDISPIPYRLIIMPWASDAESESRFRRALLVALLVSILFGTIIPLVNIPIAERAAVEKIPERLAMLVKKEPPPVPKRPKEEKKKELKEEKPKKTDSKKKSKKPQEEKRVAKKSDKPAVSKTKAARKKAESIGVLAFKSNFADLMDETPIAKLGAEAKLNKNSPRAAGSARARRSLVAMAGGSSGGIANSSVSRNVGYGDGGGGGNADQIGGVGFAKVGSSLAGLVEEEGRPLSDGPGAGRTDEEIQIVFDRYKALLYRIYNKELRKDPTLRGKLLLRLTIEPDGTVSLCKVESTDLASPHLVTQIVARVERFNFGSKDGVPKTTILYPIDFLPAG